MRKNRKSVKHITLLDFDLRMFGTTVLMVILGLIAVTDASAPSALVDFSDKYFFLKKQLASAGVGLVLMLILSKIDYRFYKKITLPVFILALIVMIMVLLPGFSSRTLGAKRWLVIGSFNFQPSEIAKFAMVLYIAKLSVSVKKLAAYFLPLVVFSVLIMLEPDLGTTLVLVFIFFSQIFIIGLPIRYLLFAFSGSFILGLLAVLSSSYRKQRLLTFLRETNDPLGSGYHIRQILLSLGSGGIFGVGLGQSRQKYSFLPEVATDSIFAVIAEETGFIGASVIIFLFIYFIVRSLKIINSVDDPYAKVLGSGIIAWISGQALLNIGSVVALVPLTGIPLPFISYGGTSLIMLMATTGILLNISTHARKN